MYCEQCGAQLQGYANFCQKCGHPVRSSKRTSYRNDKNTTRRMSLVCNRCGGVMTVDSDRTILSCPYCNSKELLLENPSIVKERIKNNTYRDVEFEKQRVYRDVELEKQRTYRDVESSKYQAYRDVEMEKANIEVKQNRDIFKFALTCFAVAIGLLLILF